MLIAVATVLAGLALLTFGADRFVDGAAATAHHLGIPHLLVGLIVVGFATSAPEMLVSAVAALNGNPTLGIGNAIGSNITNIGLVLGVTALLSPLAVRSVVLKREFPLMFVALIGASLLLVDLELGRGDGVILLVGLIVVVGITGWLGTQTPPDDPLVEEFGHVIQLRLSRGKALFWLLAGLALLLGGSHLLVDGAVDIARYFGVSDIVIGLTIVAVGTSLPELAASVMSTYKNEPDIALGNIIGSNMFNALGVMAMPGLLRPCTFGAEVVWRDLAYMLVLSVALLVMSWSRHGPGRIGRIEGALLLAGFVAYQGVLFFQA